MERALLVDGVHDHDHQHDHQHDRRYDHHDLHLWIMERALLVDGVHAEVDGGAGHAVEVARVVAHWTVPRGI